jgi:hypothetical protein
MDRAASTKFKAAPVVIYRDYNNSSSETEKNYQKKEI